MSNHHSRTLRTVREVVAALDGPAAVAALVDVNVTAVANWTAANAIPPRWIFAITDALAAKDIEVDRGIFRVHTRPQRTADARRTA